MYADTITLFNRGKSSAGVIWYPTVISGVNLLIDKAAIVAQFGAENKDNAVLNIRYQVDDSDKKVGKKRYLSPKEWRNQEEDKLQDSLTFTSGKEFDFFMAGDYGSTEPIKDSDYGDGFYNRMKKEKDYVFSITAVGGPYTAIPHFEIMGA